MKLNKENSRAFNSSLKKAVKELTSLNVKVRVINSYNFPNCWVEISSENDFPNDFRLQIFDAFGNSRQGLRDANNVCYGNIQPSLISGKVFQWENMFK